MESVLLQTSPKLGQLVEQLGSGTRDARAHGDKALLVLPLPHSADEPHGGTAGSRADIMTWKCTTSAKAPFGKDPESSTVQGQ